jgi:hypothetical protein
VGAYAELPEPHWRVLFQAASGMAVKGVGTRRAVHALVQQAEPDRLAVETARDHFIGILAEKDDFAAQRALHLLEVALDHGDRHGVWGSGGERQRKRHPGRWFRGESERFR